MFSSVTQVLYAFTYWHPMLKEDSYKQWDVMIYPVKYAFFWSHFTVEKVWEWISTVFFHSLQELHDQYCVLYNSRLEDYKLFVGIQPAIVELKKCESTISPNKSYDLGK